MGQRSFQVAIKFAIVLLSAASVVYPQGQAGGGTLGEPLGGAALIFRKPDNPKVDPSGGASRMSAGGGRTNGSARTRTPPVSAAVTQDRIIARGNAARSAPTPRYTEAEEQYKLAAKQDPKDARAYAGLGNVYLDQGRFKDAVESYQDALKVKPEYADVYHPLGYSLARLNRHDEAAEALRAGLKYDPDNAEIYNNLAFTYVHSEKFNEAIEVGKRAITLLGQEGTAYKQGLQNRKEVLSHAYKNLGNAYNGLKRYNEAAEALKQAAAIEPNNAAAYFNLGLALYNGGRYSEAIDAYKQVIKLRPQLAAAYYNLGLTYVAINDKASARQQYDLLKPLNAAMADQLATLLR